MHSPAKCRIELLWIFSLNGHRGMRLRIQRNLTAATKNSKNSNRPSIAPVKMRGLERSIHDQSHCAPLGAARADRAQARGEGGRRLPHVARRAYPTGGTAPGARDRGLRAATRVDSTGKAAGNFGLAD